MTLSNTTTMRLEDLMMEGDLLEVALDETEHIWRILSQTCSNTGSKGIRKYGPLDQGLPVAAAAAAAAADAKEPKKQPQQRGRKRKSDELETIRKFGRQRIEEKQPPMVKRKGPNKEAKAATTAAATTVGVMKRGPRKVGLTAGRRGKVVGRGFE